MIRRFGPMVGVLILAAALRGHGLLSFPVEQDELYTLRDAVRFLEAPSIKPVYYFLAFLLLKVVPPDPIWLRIPAFLFGVTGVWVTWLLGRRLFGRSGGMLAAVLVALSPWHIYASQFGRYWSMIYLLACLFFLFLHRAAEEQRGRDYTLTLIVGLVGVLSHPTFLFPVLGAGAGVTAALQVEEGGGPGRTRRLLARFWLPTLTFVAVVLGVLLVTGNAEALLNNRGRGVAASIRLLPAMVQWAGPVIVTCGVIGLVALWRSSTDRTWAALAAGGLVGTAVSLLAASFVTDVYADYAVSVLPLLYVSADGVVARVGERCGDRRRQFTLATLAVLSVASLPSVLSHLSDGTRFDYRPAYAYVQAHDPDRLVVGWPIAVQEYYAPDLRFVETPADSSALSELARREGKLWFVASRRRHGPVHLSPAVATWVRVHCQVALATERPRFDYRVYRVELYRCDSSERGR